MNRTICEECGGRILKKKIDYYYVGEYIGKFDAEVCNKCGEEVFEEEVADKIMGVITQV